MSTPIRLAVLDMAGTTDTLSILPWSRLRRMAKGTGGWVAHLRFLEPAMSSVKSRLTKSWLSISNAMLGGALVCVTVTDTPSASLDVVCFDMLCLSA